MAITCSTLAMTNDGTDKMNKEARVTARSLNLYCRVAVHAPEATPTTVPSSEPMVISRRLTGILRATSSLTGRPWASRPSPMRSRCR